MADEFCSLTTAPPFEEITRTLKEFMGADILTEILKIPGWKDNLMACREKVARKRR